jgi:hypothetical protein
VAHDSHEVLYQVLKRSETRFGRLGLHKLLMLTLCLSGWLLLLVLLAEQ